MNTANPVFFVLLVIVGVVIAVLLLPPTGKFALANA